MIAARLSRRADELRAARTAFVVATVVRAQRPTSVHTGDAALVLGDGTIEGFVGGACAEQSVRLHALRALETGEALLLRILPGDDDAPAAEGAVTVQNPCLSGGSLEIFLEPMLASPRVLVVGETPIAGAVARMGAELDLDMVDRARRRRRAGGRRPRAGRRGARARRAERAAPRARGGPALRRARGQPRARRGGGRRAACRGRAGGAPRGARRRPPGSTSARAPPRRSRSRSSPGSSPCAAASRPSRCAWSRPRRRAPESATAIDPVCGMAVAAVEQTPHVDHEGRRVYFCCDGCRSTWTRSHVPQ